MPKLSAKSKLLRKKKKKKTKKTSNANANRRHMDNLENAENHEIQTELEEKKQEIDLSHLLLTMTAHDLKDGCWCMDDKSGYPGKVSQLKRSAPGKHGHAKYTYKLTMPHNGKCSVLMHAAKDLIWKPVVCKNEYLFISLNNDNSSIICSDSDNKNQHCFPITNHLKNNERILKTIENQKKNEQIIITVLSAPIKRNGNGNQVKRMMNVVVSAKCRSSNL